MHFELIVLEIWSLSRKYFATEDQCLSLQYFSFVVSSFNQILSIIIHALLYKQPSLLKGPASILITWSKADKSNSLTELQKISAKALLPMC